MSEVVTNLELLKWTESGMRIYLQITPPQKQESASSDPHDPKVLLLNAPGEKDQQEDRLLKILAELE